MANTVRGLESMVALRHPKTDRATRALVKLAVHGPKRLIAALSATVTEPKISWSGTA